MPMGGGLSHVGYSRSQTVQYTRFDELRYWARKKVWTKESVNKFKEKTDELEKWLAEKALQRESKTNEATELRYLRDRFEDIRAQLKNIEAQFAEMVESKDSSQVGMELTVLLSYRERQKINLSKNVAANMASGPFKNTCLFLKSHEVLSVVRLVCKNWNNTGNTIFRNRYDRFRFIYSPLSGAMFDMRLLSLTNVYDLGDNICSETGYHHKTAKNLRGLIKYSKTWCERDAQRKQPQEINKPGEEQAGTGSQLALK